MTCIKTGAQIFLEEYGNYLIGDMFQFGDAYVFRAVAKGLEPLRPQLHFRIIRLAHWFDEHKFPSTLIFLHAVDYGYDGIPISEHMKELSL